MQLLSRGIFGRAAMPITVLALAFFAPAILMNGCSDNGGGIVIIGPGGGGTNSLLVIASVDGEEGPGSLTTNMWATVTDASLAPVSGATVTIQRPSGTITLVEDQQQPGTYSDFRNGYEAGTYTLNVTSGSDRVTDVDVVAPDLHFITYPTFTDTLPADQSIDVTWTRNAPADEAWVSTRDYSSLAEPDDGVSTVPGSGNPSRTDQRIRVLRVNRQLMLGGLPGSQFSAEIRTQIEPIVSQ